LARHVGHTSTKGIKLRASAYLDIAERTFGSRGSLALLRWALAIVFLWFGGMKFTSYEAHGNAPLIDHSPVMSWLNVVFGVQGASDVIGVIELSTAVMLIFGALNAAASALGAAMSSVTFVITLSFFLTTPGVAEPTAGGFPAISAPIGQFLLKDLVFLAASVNLLLASIRAHPK
jgi:reactive chlorine resistance protein C